MEPKVTTIEEPTPGSLPENEYFYSFDILRVICILILTFASFGLPIPGTNILRPFMQSATGILFTLYGFIVLRDGTDLTKHIKHALKVFVILFAVYGLMTLGYLRLFKGDPFMYFTKRGIFNFVVLNYWGESFCSTIWYVQATLYALIIFWIFKKFKNLDRLACIVLFIIAIITGELARLLNFSFLGNQYIPGNFLTRTMPYMLLGRLIYKKYDRLASFGKELGIELVAVGLVLSALEYFALYLFGKLGYTNHFAGFILIAAGACLMAAKNPDGGSWNDFGLCAKRMYKGMYYVFEPLGEIILLVGLFVSRSVRQMNMFVLLGGFAAAVISFGIFYIPAKHKVNREKAEKLSELEGVVIVDEDAEKHVFEADDFKSFENVGEKAEKEEVEGFEAPDKKVIKKDLTEFEPVGTREEKEETADFIVEEKLIQKEEFAGFEFVAEKREKVELEDFKM